MSRAPPPSRAQTQTGSLASACPGPDQLERLILGAGAALPGDDSLREHIDRCHDCRQQARLIRDNAAFMREFLAEVQVPPSCAPPGSGGPVAVTENLPGSSPESADVVGPRDSFPGYRLVREIARGGQGTVYEGVQIETRRRVAIKMIEAGLVSGSSPARGGSPGPGNGSGARAARARRRIERESEIAAALRHPNIVTIYDSAALADGRYALAMEFVDGVTLDEWSRRIDAAAGGDRASQREALRTKLRAIATVCDAVQYAHQNGVIHRDLKPANVLVGDDGFARVVDFGIARRIAPEPGGAAGDPSRSGRAAGVTRVGEFAGTLAYASPEQVSGDPTGVDTRSDVYSLGVILYEALAARRPYQTECSLTDAIANITRADPDPLRTVQPGDLPAGNELETIVRKALAKDRAHRYQTAGALKSDIENWLAGRAIDAKRESALYVLRKTAQRYRGAFAAGAALLVLLAAFAASMAWSARRLDRERALLASSLRSSTIERGRLLSLNGANLRAEALIWPEMRATGADISDPGLGFDSPPEVTQAAWALFELYSRHPGLLHVRSAEGSASLAFEDQDRTVRLIRSDGSGERRSAADGSLLSVQPAMFTPDGLGSRLATSGRFVAVPGPAGLELRDYQTGTAASLADPRLTDVVSAAPSPRGDLLMVLTRDGVMTLWRTSPLGPIATIGDGFHEHSAVCFSADGSRVAAGLADVFGLWSTDDGRSLGTWKLPVELWSQYLKAKTYNVQLSPDGKLIAGGFATWLIVYPADKPGADALAIANHRGFVNWATFSADSRILLSSSNDRTLRAWRPATLELIGTFEQNIPSRGWPALSSDGSLAASCDQDRSLRIWETHANRWFTPLAEPQDSVLGVRFSPDGRIVAAACTDGYIRAWRVADHALVWQSHEGGDAMTALAFSPDGATLVATTRGGSIFRWPAPIADAAAEPTVSAAPSLVASGPILPTWIGFSPDGRTLALAASDGKVRLFDAAAGNELSPIDGHSARVVEAAFSADGHTLATASADGACIIWDLATRAPRLRLDARSTPAAVRAVCFSRDGSLVATGGDDWTIRIWNARTGTLLRTIEGARQHVFGLCFHPAGNILFSCCRDPVVQVWDVRTGRELATLEGHKGLVLSMAISPDGGTLATAGADRIVGLWDLDYYQRHVRGNAAMWIDADREPRR